MLRATKSIGSLNARRQQHHEKLMAKFNFVLEMCNELWQYYQSECSAGLQLKEEVAKQQEEFLELQKLCAKQQQELSEIQIKPNYFSGTRCFVW